MGGFIAHQLLRCHPELVKGSLVFGVNDGDSSLCSE
jgi:hypothetical protein